MTIPHTLYVSTILLPLAVAWLAGMLRRKLDVGLWTAPRWVEIAGWPALAVAVTIAAAGWYAPLHLTGGDFLYSDFADHCSLVDAAARQVTAPISPRSTLIAGMVGYLGRERPVFDAMVIGGWIGSLAVALGITLWARVVAGRLAGVVAGVVMLGVGPLVLLTRTISFYPLMDGIFAMGAAATAWAIARGNVAAVCAAAVGAGLCGLTDARGLGWALAFAGLATLAAVHGPSWTPWRPLHAAGRVGAVALVLVAAWQLGRVVQEERQCAALEDQVRSFVASALRDPRHAAALAELHVTPCAGRSGYCWGWSDPRRIPGTVSCVRTMVDLVPDDLAATGSNISRMRQRHLDPWRAPANVLLLVATLGLVRQPRRWLALVLPALPFLSGYDIAAHVEGDIRRITPVLLPLPVLAGVATAVLVGSGSLGKRRGWGAALVGAVALLWLLSVSGSFPGWWSPNASWRWPFTASDEHLGLRARRTGGGAGGEACAEALLRGPGDLTWEGVIGRVRGE